MRAFLVLLVFVFPAQAADILVPAKRTSTQRGLLGEIEARMPRSHIYKDSDYITWGHEATHYLNSQIRQESGTVNGFYLGGNKGFRLNEPNATLAEIARNVKEKGPHFQLYLISQQKHWNKQSLYVIDELVAYTNGGVVGIEYKRYNRARESLIIAEEFWAYACVLGKLLERKGTSEKYLNELAALLLQCRTRLDTAQLLLKGGKE